MQSREISCLFGSSGKLFLFEQGVRMLCVCRRNRIRDRIYRLHCEQGIFWTCFLGRLSLAWFRSQKWIGSRAFATGGRFLGLLASPPGTRRLGRNRKRSQKNQNKDNG